MKLIIPAYERDQMSTATRDALAPYLEEIHTGAGRIPYEYLYVLNGAALDRIAGQPRPLRRKL